MDFPTDAIKVISSDGSTVEFLVTQLFEHSLLGGPVDMFSVAYRDTLTSTECDTREKVYYDDEKLYKAVCFEGYAEISLYVSVGDDFDPMECETCTTPSDDSKDLVAYHFQINCEPACEPDPCMVDTHPELLDSAGAPVDLPTDLVKVISSDGDSVQFLVSQLFEHSLADGPIEMLSVAYRDTLTSIDCDTREKVSYDDEKLYEAVCFDGYTEISLYVSVGDDFDPMECETCTTPSDDSKDLVAFHFQIHCEPVCEVPEPEEPPTAQCTKEVEPLFLESIGAPIDLPADAVKVISSDGDSVQFLVSQLFEHSLAEGPIEMLSVSYRDTLSSTECDTRENVYYNDEKLYDAVCFDGFADISLYVSVGDDFDPTECETCSTPAKDATDLVAFHFQIPCTPICPTVLDCMDDIHPELLDATGAQIDLPPDAIKLVSSDGETIEFVVSQLFEHSLADGPIDMLSVFYHDSITSTECDTRENVYYDDEKLYKAVCFDGFAVMSLYVSVGDDFDPMECETCTTPTDQSKDLVAFSFQTPCKPICPTPEPTEAPVCEADIELLGSVGDTKYPDLPITILDQNVDSVTFQITNTFSDTASIYTQFDKKDEECEEETNVHPWDDSITYTATCMQLAPITVIHIYITDTEALDTFGDDAEIPKCCKAGDNPAVQYTFKLYCESQCGPMDRRLLPEDEMVAISEILKKDEPDTIQHLRTRSRF